MALDTLKHLYLKELRDLYSAESQLVRALPKFTKAATSASLKNAFKDHTKQTKKHVERLNQIFAALGENPAGPKCKGIEGLIKEGKNLLKENGASPVLDTGLIGAAQKIEHYEIAGYGTARTYAQMLRQDEAVNLLQETLNEEGATDERLTELAEAIMSVESEADRLTEIDMPGEHKPVAGQPASHQGATEDQQMKVEPEKEVAPEVENMNAPYFPRPTEAGHQ
jgi:ferritin-like metal-binding protein YciE